MAKTFAVVDIKPSNRTVFEAKPSINMISENSLQQYPSTINIGQSMGLLLALTYPNTFSFDSPFHL